ncbi:hypothetical protein WR164_03530 [Philodulcilactobacillus myokoensis]|uniref:LiaF transmembrane domain-containing protein n=1 Tax=Philodulcilactobacillus myokoensis TaxID=2929573 RepID=A0A9W6ESQ3_9LACO|nr:hypothetical protein [Philodulcilactobacillus myokoensis]GLB46374.1 hypothetical protein WR164_03530 [Philodulcilactobacillus myokoensis]
MKYKYSFHRPNTFWGVVLILAAVLLILSKLNMFSVHLGLIQAIFTLIFLAVLIRSVFRLRFPGIIFSLAFLAIIYAKPLGISQLSPWTILISAILLNWGLSLIFRPFPHLSKYFGNDFVEFNYDTNHNHRNQNQDTFDGDFKEVDGEQAKSDHSSSVKIDNNLGGSTRRVDTDDFQHAEVNSSMGEVTLYLNQAKMKAEKAEINLNVSMSDVNIYLPTNWQVIDQVEHFMDDSDTTENGKGHYDKTVYLTGKVSFSDFNVYHI